MLLYCRRMWGCRRVVADRQVSAVVKSVNVVCNCNVLRPSGESGGDPDLPPVGDGEESTIRRKSEKVESDGMWKGGE